MIRKTTNRKRLERIYSLFSFVKAVESPFLRPCENYVQHRLLVCNLVFSVLQAHKVSGVL